MPLYSTRVSPSSHHQLQYYTPPIHIAFVYEVLTDCSCMCAVQIHNKWYKQRIVLRNQTALQAYPTMYAVEYDDQRRVCYESLRDWVLFCNLSMHNVSHGHKGTLVADVVIDGLHVNDAFNKCTEHFNVTNRTEYERSTGFKVRRWFSQLVARWTKKVPRHCRGR